MKEISGFEKRERVFLAGSIKNIIMSDRQFDDSELQELDVLLEEINFTDYEECLEEFEQDINDTESFWEMAETIDNTDTQELILEILYDLALQDGLEGEPEDHLINQLKDLWKL